MKARNERHDKHLTKTVRNIINRNLFGKEILGVVAEEDLDDYCALAGFINELAVFSIDDILKTPYYEKKYVGFGEAERYKVVNWFSIHTSRLGFQSCTFHLSCRIFDTFLIETNETQTQCEFAVCAAASFLLASSIVETNSDMIVPTVKQFCEAAKWLDRVKVIEKQIQILATVSKGFRVSKTPFRVLMLYLSRIRSHSLLFGAFISLIGKEWMPLILDSCIKVCDLLQYTALPTNEKGQEILNLLPPFIMWVMLERHARKAHRLDVKTLMKMFFRDICYLDGLLSREDVKVIYNSTKSVVSNYERYLSGNNSCHDCHAQGGRELNLRNCDLNASSHITRFILHKHVPYEPQIIG